MILRHHHVVRLHGSTRRQRGAALVEFAMVALFLATISAGAFDYGMAWRVGLATNESARTGARVGSALGTNYLADWYALSGARAAIQNSGRLQDVQRVVIYRSDTVTGEVPAACTTATSTTEKCNILTGAQFRSMTLSNINTTTGCITNATVANWCPSSRNNVQLTAEYYGVWIQTYYRNQFRLIAPGTTVNRDAVMRLEPTAS
jgi:Flp pilus assembly protein TadG